LRRNARKYRRGVVAAVAALLMAPIFVGLAGTPAPQEDPAASAEQPAPAAAKQSATMLPPPEDGHAIEPQRMLATRIETPRMSLGEPLETTRKNARIDLPPVLITLPEERRPAEPTESSVAETPAPRAPEDGAAPEARKQTASKSIDYSTAMTALDQSALGLSSCGKGATGPVQVAVTFAPSGRVTRATIEEGPLQGTLTGSCVARRLRSVAIPPFAGGFATVHTTLELE
jgi:hypothetical protein